MHANRSNQLVPICTKKQERLCGAPVHLLGIGFRTPRDLVHAGLVEPHRAQVASDELVDDGTHRGGHGIDVHRGTVLRERTERGLAHTENDDGVDAQAERVLDDAAAAVLIMVDVLEDSTLPSSIVAMVK